MKLNVWILSHKWEDDDSINLYPSHDAAEGSIQAYVHDQWAEGNMEGCEQPSDPAAAVQDYFSAHEDYEWYSVYSQQIDFPHLPDIPDEEVILSSQECEAILSLGSGTEASELVRDDLGLADKDQAEAILDSIHQKLKD